MRNTKNVNNKLKLRDKNLIQVWNESFKLQIKKYHLKYATEYNCLLNKNKWKIKIYQTVFRLL
jgi:hypothetical protein